MDCQLIFSKNISLKEGFYEKVNTRDIIYISLNPQGRLIAERYGEEVKLHELDYLRFIPLNEILRVGRTYKEKEWIRKKLAELGLEKKLE